MVRYLPYVGKTSGGRSSSSKPSRDYDRHHHEHQRDEEYKARERARIKKQAEGERGKELEAIKQHYLGSNKPKKRVTKPSEKFRVSFDWENTEDTSRDTNILSESA
ncbi:putative RNA helicase [Helianthus anomalus]